MKRRLFVLKQLIQGIVAQRIRFVLSSIGLLFGTFIFAMGIILSDSWYRTRLEESERVPERTMIVSGDNSRLDGMSLLRKMDGVNCTRFQRETYERVLIQSHLPGDKELTVRACLIGAENEISVGITRSVYLEGYYPADLPLVRGRSILNADIQRASKVAVIDELTERLLFEDQNALGKTITISSDTGIVGRAVSDQTLSMKIIGVVKNNYFAEQQPYFLKEQYRSEDAQITVSVCIYVPATLLNRETCESFEVYRFDNEKAYRTANSVIRDVNAQYRFYGEYLIHSRETLLSYMEMSATPIRRTIDLIAGLVLVLSCISTTSILFFSVKERFTEIGIRKAFGATSGDISRLFVLEIGLQGLICSAVSFWIAFFVGIGLQNFIQEQFSIYYHVQFRYIYLLLTLLVGLALSMLSGLLPALYASRLRIVNVMRLE